MLHENLRNLRKRKGLSQQELADKVGVVRQTISKWENGDSTPDSVSLIKIANVLQIPLNDVSDENASKKESMKCPDSTDNFETPKGWNTSQQDVGAKLKRELSNLGLAKMSIGVFVFLIILLLLLSDAKKASDMSVYGSAYTEAWRYIFEYPLSILLLITIAFFVTGIALFIRERNRSPESEEPFI